MPSSEKGSLRALLKDKTAKELVQEAREHEKRSETGE